MVCPCPVGFLKQVSFGKEHKQSRALLILSHGSLWYVPFQYQPW